MANTSARSKPPKPSPVAIDAARRQAMALIAEQRENSGDNAFLDKASQLLTRHWSKANWTARAGLIKSADWLIRMAAREAAPPAGGHPATRAGRGV